MISYSTAQPLSTGNFAIALAYSNAGLNIIPVKADGSKAPRVKWGAFIQEAYPWYQARHWFGSIGVGDASGIAIVCGVTSGNLEVMDFDRPDMFPQWQAQVGEALPGLLNTLPIVATPSDGRHVYYRCPILQRNQPLAKDEAGHVLIETRGQGGYVCAPGSPPSTHATGIPYRLINGDLCNVPTITQEQRATLLGIARKFNRYTRPASKWNEPQVSKSNESQASKGKRALMLAELYGIVEPMKPGDDYNERQEWEDILEPHGWNVRRGGRVTYWTKPDSMGNEHHATTGYCGELLYVFSTSIPGFEANKAYTKFAAYAILNWDGDFSKAARALAKLGYGQ